MKQICAFILNSWTLGLYKNILRPLLIPYRSKLNYLLLSFTSTLVLCLPDKAGAYPLVEPLMELHLKDIVYCHTHTSKLRTVYDNDFRIDYRYLLQSKHSLPAL
jgi:hypothetical protein